MATRIEVIVETPNGVHRAVVVPGQGVRAIFLETPDAEGTLKKMAINRRPPGETVSLEGPISPAVGDVELKFGVCYLVGNELFCW